MSCWMTIKGIPCLEHVISETPNYIFKKFCNHTQTKSNRHFDNIFAFNQIGYDSETI